MERDGAAAVRAVIEPTVRDLGYDLILVEIAGGGSRRILRLYVDRDAGVGLDDCVRVSREVSPLLDVEEPLQGAFVLEVSSPGLNRPLARPKDFERFRGSRVKVRTAHPVRGRRTFTGELLGLEAGDVVIDGEGGERYRLPLSAVKRANVEHRFDEP